MESVVFSKASTVLFFAYVGFDGVATLGEEVKNPGRDIPIGLIGSMLSSTKGRTVSEIVNGNRCWVTEWKASFSRPLLEREDAVLEEAMKELASDNTCFVNEEEWWTCPFDCFFYRSSHSLGVSIGDATPVFLIQGVRIGDKAACGGLLLFGGGVIRAIFSGPVVDYGRAPIDLFAVKVALEIFKKAGWASSSALTIVLDNKVLINWLENTLQRPWGIAKHIAKIDSLICGCANVQFKSAENSNMAMCFVDVCVCIVVGVYPYCVVRAEPCSLVGAYSSLVTVPIWFLPTLGLKVVKEEKKSKLWGVPLMPWIPSTSIAINVLIVASIDGASFIRFGIFYYVFIALHASYDAAKDTTDTTSAATVTNLEIGVASQIHR
ncbi:hypothetical protein V6N13_090305 [Hibiscus sabdariffa]